MCVCVCTGEGGRGRHKTFIRPVLFYKGKLDVTAALARSGPTMTHAGPLARHHFRYAIVRDVFLPLAYVFVFNVCGLVWWSSKLATVVS